jgi:hypothetical protein
MCLPLVGTTTILTWPSPTPIDASASGSAFVPSVERDNASDRYALLIGVEDYPGDRDDLVGPIRDVASMKHLLIRGYGFQAKNVRTLINSEATRDGIVSAFREFLSQATDADKVVVYYSGHGLQMDRNLGASDSEPDGKDEALYLPRDAQTATMLLDDELGALLRALRTNNVLVVLDACFSGTGTRLTAASDKVVRLSDVARVLVIPDRLIADETPADPATGRGAGDPEDHVLLAASRANEPAWVSDALPQASQPASVFTHFLVDYLRSKPNGVSIATGMLVVGGQVNHFVDANLRRSQHPQAEGRRKDRTFASVLGEEFP